MIRTLSGAATGLQAQQANIEQISNDLSNVNTDGYKKGRTEFSELMYETIKEPGGQLGTNSQTPVGIQVGMGVKVRAEKSWATIISNLLIVCIPWGGAAAIRRGRVARCWRTAADICRTGR